VDLWSATELSAALKALLLHVKDSSRVCWFIDGLDEFEGNDSEIAAFFQDIAESTNIKICMSSRPHLAFERSFKGHPELRLQDLTYRDIRNFVEDRLGNNQMMLQLRDTDEEACLELLKDLVAAANGVFLWVHLVVNSLLSGLEQDDTIAILQKRLRELPQDLETLYEHMVLRVNKVYEEEASQIYQLVAAAMMRSDDLLDVAPLSVLTMCFALDPALEHTIRETEPTALHKLIQARSEALDARLKSRTAGLVEVQRNQLDIKTVSPDMKVSYLHRTVRDFLESRETRDVLLHRTGGTAENAYLPIQIILTGITSHLAMINESRYFPPEDLNLQGFAYARRADVDSRISIVQLYDRFHAVLNNKRPVGARWGIKLEDAVQFGLFHYMRLTLQDPAASCSPTEKARLLKISVCPASEEFLSIDMIQTLLDFKADPNMVLDKESAWQSALSKLITSRPSRPNISAALQIWKDIVMLFLQSGADPTVSCKGPERFEYRGELKKKISLGNSWTASEVISTVWKDMQAGIQLKRLLHTSRPRRKRDKCNPQ
jgi:hypothetical protein